MKDTSNGVRNTMRLRFLRQSAAAAAIVGIAPNIITTAKAADNFVVVNTWGGSSTNAEAEAYYKAFTEETGLEVKTSAPVSFAN